jgi:hypothetical protein
MSDPYGPQRKGFEDLVPWADPYIAALIDKLRRQSAEEDELLADDESCEWSEPAGELPPPLGDQRDTPWEADWSPRNWPRN